MPTEEEERQVEEEEAARLRELVKQKKQEARPEEAITEFRTGKRGAIK